MPPSLRSTAPRLLLAVALVGVAWGCRDRRTLEELENTIAQIGSPPPAPGSGDRVGAGLDRVRRLFVPDGEEVLREGPVELQTGEHVDVSVPLEGSGCYTIAAWAEPDSADVDLRLDGLDGLPIAREEAPDAFPVLVDRCVDASGPYNVRLRAASGPASAVMGVWRQRDPDHRHAADVLAATAMRYAPEATPLGAVQRTELLEGGRFEVPVAVDADSCIAVVAWHGGAGDVDIDLDVHDPSGRLLGRDLGIEADAALPAICSDTAGVYRVGLRAYAGDGPVWWQTWRRDPAQVDPVAPDGEHR